MARSIEGIGKGSPAEIAGGLTDDITGVMMAGFKCGNGQSRSEEEVIILHEDAPALEIFEAGLMRGSEIGASVLLAIVDDGDESRIELAADLVEIIGAGKGCGPHFVDDIPGVRQIGVDFFYRTA